MLYLSAAMPTMTTQVSNLPSGERAVILASPSAIAVTTPLVSTVATPGLLLIHVIGTFRLVSTATAAVSVSCSPGIPEDEIVLVQGHFANVRGHRHTAAKSLPVGDQRCDGGFAGALGGHGAVLVHSGHCRIAAHPLVNVEEALLVVGQVQLRAGMEVLALDGQVQAVRIEGRLLAIMVGLFLHRHLAGGAVAPVGDRRDGGRAALRPVTRPSPSTVATAGLLLIQTMK